MTPLGLIAEYEHAEALVAAARAMKEKGYAALHAYSPYPVHAIDEVLGIKRSRIPVIMLIAGLTGASGAFFLQWWMNAYNYPLNVGGRPPFAAPAFLLVTFEMGVLFAGLAGFFSVFILSRLPRLWHPVFEVDGFERASIDRFFLTVEPTDPRFEQARTRLELEETTPLRVQPLGRLL